MVTVFFAEVSGFDKLNLHNNPRELVDELDSIFVNFDLLTAKYNLKRIRSIGDSYLCAGGIPIKNSTNPYDMVLAALEMLNYLESCKIQNGKNIWEFRMGIHTGPVSAIVHGKRKVTYDIKGETVNIAHRLEATGFPGKIIISAMTYELVKELFICDYFGKMPVKYRGDMDLYLVKGIQPELSVKKSGIVPNALFHTRLAHIYFSDLQEIILDKMEKELPEGLYYHNVKHTVDVVTEVELMGWAERLSDEELLLLKTAALFHDLGHIISYDEHELHSCELAREILPSHKYSSDQIEKICELIKATTMPPTPRNLLEQIICDSDLDYLGRIDFIPVSNALYLELYERNKIGSIEEWNEIQIKFISNHQYFTKTARALREINKQKQIERLKEISIIPTKQIHLIVE